MLAVETNVDFGFIINCSPLLWSLGTMFYCQLRFPSVPLLHITGCYRSLQPCWLLLWHRRKSPVSCDEPWQRPAAPALPGSGPGPQFLIISVMPCPTPHLAPKVLRCWCPQIFLQRRKHLVRLRLSSDNFMQLYQLLSFSGHTLAVLSNPFSLSVLLKMGISWTS